MGIAIVVPLSKIMEVVDQPMIKDEEAEATPKRFQDCLPVTE
jgi:hypothetical protein